MVADVTETRNVIPSLEFKTCMTIKSLLFYCLHLLLFYRIRKGVEVARSLLAIQESPLLEILHEILKNY